MEQKPVPVEFRANITQAEFVRLCLTNAELLAACERMLQEPDSREEWSEQRVQLSAAIARARGAK